MPYSQSRLPGHTSQQSFSISNTFTPLSTPTNQHNCKETCDQPHECDLLEMFGLCEVKTYLVGAFLWSAGDWAAVQASSLLRSSQTPLQGLVKRTGLAGLKHREGGRVKHMLSSFQLQQMWPIFCLDLLAPTPIFGFLRKVWETSPQIKVLNLWSQ